MDRTDYVNDTIENLAIGALFCFRAVRAQADAEGLALSDETCAALAAPLIEEGYRRLRVIEGDPAEGIAFEPDVATSEPSPAAPAGHEPVEELVDEPTAGDPKAASLSANRGTAERSTEAGVVRGDILRLMTSCGITKNGYRALIEPTGAAHLDDVPLRHLLEIRAALRDPARVEGANVDGFLRSARAEIDALSSEEAKRNRTTSLLYQAKELFGFGSEPYERIESRLVEVAAGKQPHGAPDAAEVAA